MTCLAVKRRQVGSKDSHGNPVITFGPEQHWGVWAYAPGANEEPGQPNRDLSLIAWSVYAATSSQVPAEGDRVVLDAVEYEVDGRPEDWTHGPWPQSSAGVVVRLKVTEG